MARKITSISIPETWLFKLKRKAIKQFEETGKYTTVSRLIVEAIQEKYSFKLEKGEK